MTETEAKTKNCPLFSAAALIAVAKLTGGTAKLFDESRKCEGASCMLWRWSDAQRRLSPEELSAGVPLKSDGYCGLAGKP